MDRKRRVGVREAVWNLQVGKKNEMKGSTKIVGKTKAVWQAKDKIRIDIPSYLPVGEEEGGEREQMLRGIGRKASRWPAQLGLGIGKEKSTEKINAPWLSTIGQNSSENETKFSSE